MKKRFGLEGLNPKSKKPMFFPIVNTKAILRSCVPSLFLRLSKMDTYSDRERDAVRLKTLAETKFANANLKSALKYAKKAHNIAPTLDGISSMVTAFKILRVSAKSRPNAAVDWYKILQVEPFSHINTIKKQYKKLALVLHPDKNPYVGCEEAFKLVSEGTRVLSDKIRRKEYDMKLRIRMQEETLGNGSAGGLGLVVETFWTACSRCRLLHQFERRYLGHNLVCPSCKKSFEAVEVEGGDKVEGGARVRSERLKSKGSRVNNEGFKDLGLTEKMGRVDLKKKVVGSEKMGSVGLRRKGGRGGVGTETLKGKSKSEYLGGELGSGEWSGGRFSGRLRRRTSTVDEVLERSKPKRVKLREDMMTLAEMQLEAKSRVSRDKVKLKEKDLGEKVKGTEGKHGALKNGFIEVERIEDSKKSGDVEMEMFGAVKNLNLEIVSHGTSKKHVGSDIKKRSGSKNGNIEIMVVEDSDFYDFDRDRVERSFRKGQIWAIYDDDDGMPRHYGLIDEIMSVNPFEVKLSWLDIQNNGNEGLICLEKMGLHVPCGRFKVARKTSINSVNIFSHVMECERAAREVYRIYPNKGSVWALYKEAALGAEGRNLSAKDQRGYDIVVFLTTYSEIHGLSMAYLEKVDGFKAIFKRREVGSHAIRWLQKDDIWFLSHQIPARKLLGNDIPDLLKDCWELDPASLPLDLVSSGWGR